MEDFKSQINADNLPNHIAIIMDGNGRWAEMKGKPRKKLRIPAGSLVDKPKHSKAHKTRFCGLFVFKAHQNRHLFSYVAGAIRDLRQVEKLRSR